MYSWFNIYLLTLLISFISKLKFSNGSYTQLLQENRWILLYIQAIVEV